jgi:predicted RNA-binding protein with RPS1 domain
VTRLADFGAFVELEPGIEALAHASTFAPTGRSDGWSSAMTQGMTGAFEILSIDREKKRIGVALVPEGSARAADVREYADRADAAPAEGFGSLADKLRGALKPRER